MVSYNSGTEQFLVYADMIGVVNVGYTRLLAFPLMTNSKRETSMRESFTLGLENILASSGRLVRFHINLSSTERCRNSTIKEYYFSEHSNCEINGSL